MPHPDRSSGSDQSKSHIGPSWGTSWTRSSARIWSNVSIEGDKPPCKQKIYSFHWVSLVSVKVTSTYLIFHHGSQRQIVKHIRKILPNCCGSIFALAFVIKSVHLRNLTTLMIPSEDKHAIFVSYFQTHQQCDCFNLLYIKWISTQNPLKQQTYGIISPIDIVAHEQIIGVRGQSPNAKEFH